MIRRNFLKLLALGVGSRSSPSDQDRLMAMLDRAGILFDTPSRQEVVIKVDSQTVTGLEGEYVEFHFSKLGTLKNVVLWSSSVDNRVDEK